MSTTHPDTLSLVVTREQAERLLALVDAANVQTKNCLVKAVLHAQAEAGRGGYAPGDAEHLAQESEALTTLRANIYRRLDCSLAR
jgi:hypothetical protein